jgi:transcription elongation factor Elf1
MSSDSPTKADGARRKRIGPGTEACAKCGGESVALCYVEARDKVQCACPRCGYAWDREPVVAEPVVSP